MIYWIHILIMAGIYFILIGSAQLMVGMTNLVTLSQAAFYGLGAYFSAFILLNLQWSLVPTLITILLLNASLAYLISKPTIKLKGDFFILATLGFQIIIYSLLYNLTDITQGPYGISGIPSGKVLGIWSIEGSWSYLALTFFLSGIVYLITYRIINSPFGRNLKAVREDETLMISLGRNPVKYKIIAVVVSSALSSWGGFIYATYVSYIDPTSFNLDESIFILAAVVIGGLGNTKGALAGAFFVVLLPELIRFIGLPDTYAAPLRQIIYGLSLLAMMYFRPQGIAGNYILR